MDGEELRRRYATGERDFSGLDLTSVNISGSEPMEDIFVDIDLSGIDLSGADLTGVILAGANLSGAIHTAQYFVGNHVVIPWLIS